MRKLQLAAKVSVAAEAKAPCTKPPVVAAGGNQGAKIWGGFSLKKPNGKKSKTPTWCKKGGDSLYIYIYNMVREF